jgi:hypothetical protein
VEEESLMADFSQVIGPKNLMYLAWQISKGMTFLISRKVRQHEIIFISPAKQKQNRVKYRLSRLPVHHLLGLLKPFTYSITHGFPVSN